MRGLEGGYPRRQHTTIQLPNGILQGILTGMLAQMLDISKRP